MSYHGCQVSLEVSFGSEEPLDLKVEPNRNRLPLVKHKLCCDILTKLYSRTISGIENLVQVQFLTDLRPLLLDLLEPCIHRSWIFTDIHNVDIQTLYSVQTQHGQMKAIFLTCFNLNKASLLPACTHMHVHTHTYTYFCSPSSQH